MTHRYYFGIRRSRLFSAVAVGLVFFALVSAANTTPAHAHDELVSTTPTAGAVLDSAPTQVVLNFSSEPMPGTVKVVAMDSDGGAIPLAAPKIDGKSVSVAWPTKAPGSYGVVWRVTSHDGHPINGTLNFKVAGAESATTPPAKTPSDPTATANATTNPTAATGSSSAGIMAGLAIVVVAAVVLVALLVKQRQNKRDDNPGTHSNE